MIQQRLSVRVKYMSRKKTLRISHLLCIMIFPIRTTFTFVVCILLLLVFHTAELVAKYYQRHFKLKFFGSLTNDEDVLFTGEGTSFITAVKQCAEFCRRDRRCIGMELCKITEDRIRCRVSCKTKEEVGTPLNNTDTCSYMAMDEEPKVNIAVNKPAAMSSIYRPDYQHASNAVDNVTVCPTGLSLAHTKNQFRPWIKIDLQEIYNVDSVVIYNRQDKLGYRLHDLQISIGINETENTCGFYEGPAVDGDRIVVCCTSSARGNYVLMTILSAPGETDTLHVCEVQVFVNN